MARTALRNDALAGRHAHARDKAPMGAKPFVIADGTLEALKWLGLVLMALDHANRFLFGDRLPFVFEAARLVMPLFGFVLAYHLSRPDALRRGVHVRVMRRLLLFGLLATVPFVALVGWWPLNILYTLLVAVAILYLAERGAPAHQVTAGVLLTVGGMVVEFWWPALLCVMSAWAWCRQPTPGRLLLWAAATASLGLVNGNLWSLLAVPLVLAASRINLGLPRWRLVFYGFYPAHLAALWLAQRLLA